MANNVVELTAHDALVGEVLGELVLLRQAVDELKGELPQLVTQLKDAGELVSLRLDDQLAHIVGELDERTKTLNAAANEFRDVRELLMGEVAIRTTAHFTAMLRAEARRVEKARRSELVLSTACGSLLTLGLVGLGWHLLKHI
jgi:hypothetical protein